MTDIQEVAQEATEEVVQPEAEQVEAPEAAESTEGSPETEQPAEVKAEEEKPPSRHQRRKAQMESLRSQAAEAEARAKVAETRLSKFEEVAKSHQPPKEADFQTIDEFEAARTAWYAGQEFTKLNRSQVQLEADEAKAEVQKAREQQAAEAQKNWADQAEEARSRYSDFDAVVQADDLKVTADMAAVLTASEVGADVAYYLGTNKATAAQIASLPPLEQAMEIGRLAASIKPPASKAASSAPAPISPVKGVAQVTQKDPANMSISEYRAWRQAGGKVT